MATRKTKIGFVDDSEEVILPYKLILENEGYEVIKIIGAKNALHELPKHKDIDLLFVDHQMPDLTGPELMAIWKEEEPEFFNSTRFVGFSGSHITSQAAQEFYDSGALYLEKSCDIYEFLRWVKTRYLPEIEDDYDDQC